MRRPKLDRRPSRTQALLRGAFFDLIRARGYEAVSVADIAAAADVGRSTFYEHFSSKEDLLRESMSGLLGALADAALDDQPSQRLHATMAHFWENRRLANAVFSGAARRVLVRGQARALEARLAQLAKARRSRPLLPLSLAAQQIAEAQVSLLLGWLTGSTRLTSDAVTLAIHASTRASASALTGRCDLAPS